MTGTITLPTEHDGLTKNLDGTATTMWFEPTKRCPNGADHLISGSTRRLYCYKCGVWWYRK